MPGRTVVFVPGFMQHADAWSPVAERVGERYPTLCVDPTGDSLAARMREIGQCVRAGDVLVGYSMGGRVALRLAVEARPPLGGLVVVGASAGIEDPRARVRRREADDELAAWMETASIADVVRRWEQRQVFASQTPELVAAQRPGRLAHDPRRLASLLRSAGQGATPPIWDRLPELSIPVLAVAGELDGAYATQARRVATLIRRGEARIVRGAGHAAHLEQRELPGHGLPGLEVANLDDVDELVELLRHLVDRL
ncbi:MAG: alpha/beta fold hydrolase, partial [Actinobacteria bacterium]|nr:alpha/beta fold hydrolase [Actinomycetota bacterium]